MMRFDQCFYGRGLKGYGVMGSSLQGSSQMHDIHADVESLCKSVGNPVNEQAEVVEPFLMQWIKEPLAFLVCGRRGPLDDRGRATLFFHVLVADASELRSVGVSAADCFRKQLFVSSMPAQDIEPLLVDMEPFREDRKRLPPKIKLPAIVCCRWEDNLKVLDLLGNANAVGVNWSTFSWEPIDGFEVCGVAPWRRYLELKKEINVYDVNGGPIPRVSDTKDSCSELELHSETPLQHDNAKSRLKPKHSVMLWKFLVLVGLVVGVLLGRKVSDLSGIGPLKLGQSADVRSKLIDGRFWDDLEILKPRKIESHKFEEKIDFMKESSDYRLYRDALSYIELVNKYFLEQKKEVDNEK